MFTAPRKRRRFSAEPIVEESSAYGDSGDSDSESESSDSSFCVNSDSDEEGDLYHTNATRKCAMDHFYSVVGEERMLSVAHYTCCEGLATVVFDLSGVDHAAIIRLQDAGCHVDWSEKGMCMWDIHDDGSKQGVYRQALWGVPLNMEDPIEVDGMRRWVRMRRSANRIEKKYGVRCIERKARGAAELYSLTNYTKLLSSTNELKLAFVGFTSDGYIPHSEFTAI